MTRSAMVSASLTSSPSLAASTSPRSRAIVDAISVICARSAAFSSETWANAIAVAMWTAAGGGGSGRVAVCGCGSTGSTIAGIDAAGATLGTGGRVDIPLRAIHDGLRATPEASETAHA